MKVVAVCAVIAALAATPVSAQDAGSVGIALGGGVVGSLPGGAAIVPALPPVGLWDANNRLYRACDSRRDDLTCTSVRLGTFSTDPPLTYDGQEILGLVSASTQWDVWLCDGGATETSPCSEPLQTWLGLPVEPRRHRALPPGNTMVNRERIQASRPYYLMWVRPRDAGTSSGTSPRVIFDARSWSFELRR